METEYQNKMRMVFRIAQEKGHAHIVLSALGSGAFGNPPATVARLWAEVLAEKEFQEGNVIKNVYFCVIQDHNDRERNAAAHEVVFHGLGSARIAPNNRSIPHEKHEYASAPMLLQGPNLASPAVAFQHRLWWPRVKLPGFVVEDGALD